MSSLYADENFFFDVVEYLRDLGHDILTSRDAGQANKQIPDEEVLAFATAKKRAVLTFNYQHFKRLHRFYPNHAGIIICTEDMDFRGLANRIHEAILHENEVLGGKLVRVNRPNL